MQQHKKNRKWFWFLSRKPKPSAEILSGEPVCVKKGLFDLEVPVGTGLDHKRNEGRRGSEKEEPKMRFWFFKFLSN